MNRKGNPNLHKSSRKFSSTYQPENYRTSVKPLTDLLKKNLESPKTIEVEGVLLVNKGESEFKAGDRVTIEVVLPTKDILIASLLRAAAKGNLKALDMIMDRVEGKPIMKLGFDDGGDGDTKMAGFVVYSDGRRERLD